MWSWSASATNTSNGMQPFDAGYASALGKPLIVNHTADLTHPLKEVDAAALAVCETPEQVVDILRYVIMGKLPI